LKLVKTFINHEIIRKLLSIIIYYAFMRFLFLTMHDLRSVEQRYMLHNQHHPRWPWNLQPCSVYEYNVWFTRFWLMNSHGTYKVIKRACNRKYFFLFRFRSSVFIFSDFDISFGYRYLFFLISFLVLNFSDFGFDYRYWFFSIFFRSNYWLTINIIYY